MIMIYAYKLLMKRMKKIDSKVNYKKFHLDLLKEIEKSEAKLENEKCLI
jgi:hypothetical protein